MIRKMLIANRGEVAVRIARACTELDIVSVAIYTEADRHALHVKQADTALPVGRGAGDALGGYLDVYGLVELALRAGCDALHPGYGFLSENPDLAQACARRGIAFVGPPADVIQRMGDKIEARRAMQAAGVPVVPGSDGSVADLDAALQVARRIGYPVMVKATAGGGGRGIRRCQDEDELTRAFARVVSEATKAFGRADVFIEKAIVNPRHIEVQVLADKYGNTIHLFERDCSIQRRHQKLVEIAPSPQLTDAQRHEVCALGLRAAQAVSYENAGTVEFLLDAEGRFYFMEMNTRLQVEHTITEQITGIDIVQEQIRIAEGKSLSWKQQQIQANGYAIQFRINAEDPKNGFAPSFGRITRCDMPGGPGVRTDSAIYPGYEFPPHFDSMCAKLTVWAPTWEGVLARGRRALLDLALQGVKTTKPFHLEILKARDFRAAQFDTGFIEQHPELLDYDTTRAPREVAAAIAAAVVAYHGF